MGRRLTGSIYPTEHGFRLQMTLPTGRLSETFATEEDAEMRRLAVLEILTKEGLTGGMTLGAWGERALTKRELSGDIRDWKSDWGRWNAHVKNAPIARMPLKTIQRRDVTEWLDGVRKKVKAQNVLNLVRTVLRMAVEDGYLRANPAREVRVPKEKRTEEPWTYLTPHEQQRLLKALEGNDRCVVAFAMGSGLRAGELVALRWKDVHLKAEVPYAVVRYGGPPHEPTKTGKIREVPLFGMALDAIKAMPRIPSKYGLVFPRPGGTFRTVEHILPWSVWKGALEKARIKRDFRWHDLRHTCASSLVSGWWGSAWSLTEVRDMLGHQSITTTERYAHMAPTALKLAAKRTDIAQGLAKAGKKYPRKHGAPPAEVESATNGLGKRLKGKGNGKLPPNRGTTGAIAKKLLKAVEEGSPHAVRIAVQLADAVLAAEASVSPSTTLRGAS